MFFAPPPLHSLPDSNVIYRFTTVLRCFIETTFYLTITPFMLSHDSIQRARSKSKENTLSLVFGHYIFTLCDCYTIMAIVAIMSNQVQELKRHNRSATSLRTSRPVIHSLTMSTTEAPSLHTPYMNRSFCWLSSFWSLASSMTSL